MTTNTQLRLWKLLTFGSIFTLIFIFFYKVNPGVPYNGDDWGYFVKSRYLWPNFAIHNPARVLHQLFAPLYGLFSAYIITPLVGDYILGFIVTRALILSTSITLLCVFFYKMCAKLLAVYQENSINSTYSQSQICWLSLCLTIIFISLCFIVFKTTEYSMLIFSGSTLTIDLAYTVPNIVNSILLCVLISYRAQGNIVLSGYLQWGFFFLFIYLAMFSLTFSSLIVATYAGSSLLLHIITEHGNLKEKILSTLKSKNNLIKSYALLLFLWLTAALADFFGGRIESAEKLYSTVERNVGANILEVFNQVHIFIYVFAIIFLGAFFILALKKQGHSNADRTLFMHLVGALIMASLLTLTADALINIKVGANLSRPTVAYNFIFLGLMACILSAVFIFKHFPKTLFLIPCFLLILPLEAIMHNKHSYKLTSAGRNSQYLAQDKARIDNIELVSTWVNNLKAATARGDTQHALYVPHRDWPYYDSLAIFIPKALYLHGQIPYKIKVSLSTDKKHLHTKP